MPLQGQAGGRNLVLTAFPSIHHTLWSAGSLSIGSSSFINMKRKTKESKRPAVGKGQQMVSRWPARANAPPDKGKQASMQSC